MFFGSWCRAGRIEDETDKNGARKVLFKRNTFNEDRICMCHARYCTGKTQYFNQIMHARAPSGAIVCIYVQFPIWIFTELFEDFSNPVPPEISEFKIVFPTWGIQDYKTYSTYSSYFHDHSSMHRAGKMSHAGSIPVVFSLRKPLPPAQRTRFPGGKLIRARALKLIGTYRHAGIEFQQCQGLTGPSSKFSWGESRKPGISQRAGPKGCHLDQDAVGC